MQITIAIVMISTVQSAAIKTSTIDDSASNDILEVGLEAEVSAQSDDSFPEMIPDWLIEFKEYIDSEEDFDFDLMAFLDKLEQNEVKDFFNLLVLLIDDELLDVNETGLTDK